MRRTYKLLHWDYGTNRGVATDGTKFDGEPIVFEVRGQDLSPEHNGHLLLNEVFTAYEDSAGDHHLYDILIEEGARAIATPSCYQPVGYADEGASFVDADFSHLDVKKTVEAGHPVPIKDIITGETIYTVPLHVGQNIEVPEHSKVTFYRTSNSTLEERVSKLEKDLNELWNKVFGDEESR